MDELEGLSVWLVVLWMAWLAEWSALLVVWLQGV